MAKDTFEAQLEPPADGAAKTRPRRTYRPFTKDDPPLEHRGNDRRTRRILGLGRQAPGVNRRVSAETVTHPRVVTDTISFAVMDRLGVATTFTFDRGFERYGFAPARG